MLYAAVVVVAALAAVPVAVLRRASARVSGGRRAERPSSAVLEAARSFWWPPPVAASVLWAVVAVASSARLLFPELLDAFRREPARTRDSGEWWRILTAGMVEDGGVAVTLLNLVLLAIAAIVAVRVWDWYRAVGLFVLGQVLWGLFTTFVSPSVGAGTSGATLALAASLAGLWPVVGAPRRLLAGSATTFVLGAVLVLFGDAHGVAVLIGMLLGAVLGTVLPPVRPAPDPGAITHGDVRT